MSEQTKLKIEKCAICQSPFPKVKDSEMLCGACKDVENGGFDCDEYED